MTDRVCIVHISVPEGPFILRTATHEWEFEVDNYPGAPHLLKKNGEPKKHDIPAERSPFWPAYEAWVKGGKRTEPSSDGKKFVCILDSKEMKA